MIPLFCLQKKIPIRKFAKTLMILRKQISSSKMKLKVIHLVLIHQRATKVFKKKVQMKVKT